MILLLLRRHHHCPIQSLHSAHSPQFTLLKTVTDPENAKRFLRDLISNTKPEVNMEKSTYTDVIFIQNVTIASRSRIDQMASRYWNEHSQTLNKPKAGIHDIIKEEVDMSIRGAQLPIRPNYNFIINHSHSCIYFRIVEKSDGHQGSSSEKYRGSDYEKIVPSVHQIIARKKVLKAENTCRSRIRPKLTRWVASMGEK